MQKGRARIGIRGKLLAFLSVAVISILALEIVAQRLTYQIADEYKTHLDRYHQVHRLRIALSDFRIAADRFLREPNNGRIEILYESISSLAMLDASLASLEEISVEAGFEVRAVGYGMDVYLPLVGRSLSLRSSGRTDYYADFAKSERIAGYMDTYLSRLSGILMKNGEARYAEAAVRTKHINDAILIGMLAAGFLLLVYVYLVANSITKPIRILAKASERLSMGEMDVNPPAAFRSKDEVAILAERFYSMSANIRTYIESLKDKAELEKKLREEETSLLAMGKALREAQLMNLQDQMRPHFLFNALNSIARTALLEGAKESERLTISLAKLLRATMKEKGPFISLSEEMEIVKEYLAFQKARFGDRLRWRIEFDQSLGAMEIPRFLLQPLVENAVRHGVEPKEGSTDLLLAVRRREEKIIAHVIDTGAGMGREDLENLRIAIASAWTGPGGQKIKAKDSGSLVEARGIGVGNVATRLAMLYGKDSSMSIQSIRGKGTILKIHIPFGRAL
ncbi:MAG: integral membrane sensor signal transduction histidine kinase [Spirochaetes bacterium]|nr:MAG: integral membrane sensor signal transduction histidine kinase [Spirochaetota bacterium]